MTLEQNKPVETLIDIQIDDNGYIGFGDFESVPFNKTYLHLLGHFKRDLRTCKMLESYVIRYFPEKFKLLIDLFDKTGYTWIKFPKFYSFSLKQNNDIIDNFLVQIKKGDINSLELPHFFLARDLLSVDLPKRFHQYLLKKEIFSIYLYPIYDVQHNSNGNTLLKIKNLEDENFILEVDEIDLIIMKTIKKPIRYDSFISNMKNYVEDRDNEIENQLIELINKRIIFLITCKLILIYK
ncbi:hypothetical protein IBL28_22075 [Sinomicrobium sp. FJxs]|uniref:DUF6734 domain-containing protein n=2 Tax=Sinomicrobium weinanense TaxID=2842200 RepID=A0A926Q4J5_9FLAO|nr:DUF6734 family protein [Sinomicrobium weinanense]MBC9798668.1 hypothetical protein [Sinomicrobium weinanense]MBU3126030.1 hypothetical protein [Sinomicrobium weinanense]